MNRLLSSPYNMAPDLDSLVPSSMRTTSDIKVEVDTVVGNLSQRLREVNRKVLSLIFAVLLRLNGLY